MNIRWRLVSSGQNNSTKSLPVVFPEAGDACRGSWTHFRAERFTLLDIFVLKCERPGFKSRDWDLVLCPNWFVCLFEVGTSIGCPALNLNLVGVSETQYLHITFSHQELCFTITSQPETQSEINRKLASVFLSGTFISDDLPQMIVFVLE